MPHNIGERLGVAIDKREPAALHVNHKSMSLSKSVVDIRHGKLDGGHFTRHKWLWILERIAKFASENQTL